MKSVNIKQRKYYKLMNDVLMADDRSTEGEYSNGIEYYLSKVQYQKTKNKLWRIS